MRVELFCRPRVLDKIDIFTQIRFALILLLKRDDVLQLRFVWVTSWTRTKEREKKDQFGFLIWKKCGTTEPNDALESSRRITTTTAIEKKKTRGNRTQTPTREHINPTSAEVSFFERAILRDVCDLYTKLKAWREEREEKRLDFRAIGSKE